MTTNIYKNLCIANIFNGLVEGLSKFSSQSKVALIYAPTPNSDILIYDPQNILKEHETILKEKYYSNKDTWIDKLKKRLSNQPDNHLVPIDILSLAGLINYGAASRSFFFPDLVYKSSSRYVFNQAN